MSWTLKVGRALRPLLFAILGLLGASSVAAQQTNATPPATQRTGFLTSWTSDRHGLQAGDIITILVDEHLLASAQADESATQLRDRDFGFSTGTGGTTIRGWIRPQDLSLHNTVESWRLTDTEILLTSNAELGKAPGLLSKLLNWIW